MFIFFVNLQWWTQLLKRVACEEYVMTDTHRSLCVWLKAWPVISRSPRTSSSFGSDTSTWSNGNWNVWWLSPANMPLPSLKVIEFWSISLSLFGSVIQSVRFKELSVPPGVRSHQHDGHTAGGLEQMHFSRCLNRQHKDMLECQRRRPAHAVLFPIECSVVIYLFYLCIGPNHCIYNNIYYKK